MTSSIRTLLYVCAVVAPSAVRAQGGQEQTAADLPRFHVGVGVGPVQTNNLRLSMAEVGGIPAQLGTEAIVAGSGNTGRKFVLGFQPLRVVGMELQYLDFSHGPAVDLFKVGGRVPLQVIEAKGSSDARVASALLFISERAPKADIYAKVGVARVHESVELAGYTALLPGCVPAIPACEVSETVVKRDSAPYVGFGARFRIAHAPVAVRVELESIGRDAGDPITFLSAGIAAEF